mmetsp:Transcript_21507/g.35591  ORF Transcript_21507/g.35591 Transcript_21507/m.35591 type:complete len:362 (+) Transcript_21507:236-1321(+)
MDACVILSVGIQDTFFVPFIVFGAFIFMMVCCCSIAKNRASTVTTAYTTTYNPSSTDSKVENVPNSLLIQLRYGANLKVPRTVPISNQGEVSVFHSGMEVCRYEDAADRQLLNLPYGEKVVKWSVRDVLIASAEAYVSPVAESPGVCQLSIAEYPCIITVLSREGLPIQNATVSVLASTMASKLDCVCPTNFEGTTIFKYPPFFVSYPQQLIVVVTGGDGAWSHTETVSRLIAFEVTYISNVNGWANLATLGQAQMSSESPAIVYFPPQVPQPIPYPDPALLPGTPLHDQPSATAPPPPLPLIPADSDNQLCITCDARPRNVLLDPCGHLILCNMCAVKLIGQPCPICRAHVNKLIRVFTS